MKTINERINELREVAEQKGETFDLSKKYIKVNDYRELLEFCVEIASEGISIIDELQSELETLKKETANKTASQPNKIND